ncbi:hypothetical protein ACLOJK_025155 [Asimina triloba]
MNISPKGFSANQDGNFKTLNKSTALNPNAAEFVPFALRSPSGGAANNTELMRVDASASNKKAAFDRSESSVSNNSDDEVHQYWRRQLPDDITPDFKVMGEDDLQGSVNLSFTGLSIHDGIETSRFAASAGSSHLLSKQQEASVPSYGEDHSSAFVNLQISPWDKRFINDDQHFANGSEPYNGDSGGGLHGDLVNEQAILDDVGINAVEFLAFQFPGFAADSLAEVYYANGCDLNRTIEMLAQLEESVICKIIRQLTPNSFAKAIFLLHYLILLQNDTGFNQNLSSKALSAPNLSALDFPALSVPDAQNGLSKYAGDDLHQQTGNLYRSMEKDNLLLFKSPSSAASRTDVDFASAVRKLASQDSGKWKYERNGSSDVDVGSSRNSQLLTGSFNGRSTYGDKLQSYGSSRAGPVWLETGDAQIYILNQGKKLVITLDFAMLALNRNMLTFILRNNYVVCHECSMARQAYLIGNKALAKELSMKGQFHNSQMKTAHVKASESIYRQRNPIAPELQSYGRGRDRLIDLHGLHVVEAISKLKHDLGTLRSMARTVGQRLQVFICVGTGHHTKGTRAQARLPAAVERYLLEEEGLEYSETQPGMLRPRQILEVSPAGCDGCSYYLFCCLPVVRFSPPFIHVHLLEINGYFFPPITNSSQAKPSISPLSSPPSKL